MYQNRTNAIRELLTEIQSRVPSGVRFVQEAFTTEHRRPVLVKLTELTPETFYLFDEVTTQAFRDAVVEVGARDGGGRLTISYSFAGEIQAQLHRLQRVAGKLGRIRVLTVGSARSLAGRDTATDFHDIAANPLARYSLVIKEGARPLLFICRENGQRKLSKSYRTQGFFSVNREIVEEVADDVELLLRGVTTTLVTFDELETLHRTTQRISRELESYSRRVEWAVRHARRRPDLLTPARFDRIVGQAIAKMGQLKEIPRRALQSIERNTR
jgi:hypothetical protein